MCYLPEPGGANINDYNSFGLTMLHEAITKQDTQSALFLLQRQADANAKYVYSDKRCCKSRAYFVKHCAFRYR